MIPTTLDMQKPIKVLRLCILLAAFGMVMMGPPWLISKLAGFDPWSRDRAGILMAWLAYIGPGLVYVGGKPGLGYMLRLLAWPYFAWRNKGDE